jgi:L-asparaginase/Glu-tRNA(Gln) amidotransferase subunit D
LRAHQASIDFARLPGPHMTPARMLELAQCVEAQLSMQIDGVVITHEPTR